MSAPSRSNPAPMSSLQRLMGTTRASARHEGLATASASSGTPQRQPSSAAKILKSLSGKLGDFGRRGGPKKPIPVYLSAPKPKNTKAALMLTKATATTSESYPSR